MDINMLIRLVLIGLGIFLFLLIATIISVVSIIIYSGKTQDRIDQCIALIHDGVRVLPLLGVMINANSKGVQYQLKNGLLVTVPHKYKVKYVKHKRFIECEPDGTIIPEKQGDIKQSEYNIVIKSLTLGNFAAKMINNIKGENVKGGLILIIGIIVVILAVGGGFAYTQYKKQQAQQPPPITQNTTPENPSNNITISQPEGEENVIIQR